MLRTQRLRMLRLIGGQARTSPPASYRKESLSLLPHLASPLPVLALAVDSSAVGRAPTASGLSGSYPTLLRKAHQLAPPGWVPQYPSGTPPPPHRPIPLSEPPRKRQRRMLVPHPPPLSHGLHRTVLLLPDPPSCGPSLTCGDSVAIPSPPAPPAAAGSRHCPSSPPPLPTHHTFHAPLGPSPPSRRESVPLGPSPAQSATALAGRHGCPDHSSSIEVQYYRV